MRAYTNPNEDVPSPIDLRDASDAAEWAAQAESARPGRPELRAAIVEELAKLPSGARVLELGSGPGFLAEAVLSRCTNVARYTLLDFSEPMLAMSRERLHSFSDRAELLFADFKTDDWSTALSGEYDAVVSMQAVHEIRHKRHVPGLYRQVHAMLRAGGLLLTVDHTPMDDSLRMTSLYMTEAEQQATFVAAGFADVRTLLSIERLYLVLGMKG